MKNKPIKVSPNMERMPTLTEDGPSGKIVGQVKPKIKKMPTFTNTGGTTGMTPVTSLAKYSPIKSTKQVNKLYKTY